MRYKIVVCMQGFVLVGVLEDDHEQGIVFSRAAVIRQWGTTKGLGELADGPTSKTITDLIPQRTKVERRNIIYDFEARGWDKRMGDDA